MRKLVIATAVVAAGLGLAIPSFAIPSGQATYVDTALGISFTAPANLYYVPARLTNSEFLGQTTQATLSTYQIDQPPSDFRNAFLVTFVAARRETGDLGTIARGKLRAKGTVKSAAALVGGRPALVLEGEFANGPRVIALVDAEPTRILVVQAFPTFSSKRQMVDEILKTVSFSGGQSR